MNWGVVVQPIEAKAQQSGVQLKESESVVKGKDSQKETRRTFKILREI